ncbi:MAG TPA: hypothetical protein VHJ20_16795 [Polyangia bacterium]|nr:hypothetical protein [Polyangia bacterium]
MTRRALLMLLAAMCAPLFARGARADVSYELAPSAGVGATDNAGNRPKPTTIDHDGDGFTDVTGIGRLHIRDASAEHVAGLRLSWMHYLQGRGIDSLASELSWLSTITPVAPLELKLGAAGSYGQTSGYVPVGAVDMLTPQAAVSGAHRYLGATANETATWDRTAQNRYVQTFMAQFLHYLPTGTGGSSNVETFNLHVRAEWVMGRNTFGGEGDANELGGTNRDPFFTVSALAFWRRDLTLEWSSELRAGVALLSPPGVPGMGTDRTVNVAPVGFAQIGYRDSTDIAWFATLEAAQTTTTNLYLGAITLNDNAMARLTLPLTRNERAVVSGYGGLVYGRIPTGGRAYDQRIAGALFALRGQDWPLWLTLDYSFSDQHGNGQVDAVTGAITGFPDLRRQVILLSVGGTFIFGPGTPPIFPGSL